MAIIYGKNSVITALEAGTVLKLYVRAGDKKLLALAQAAQVPVKELASAELDRLAGGNHQGIAAEVKDYRYASLPELLADPAGLILVLDGITDPHNFGAIIRSAAGAGVSGIVIPKTGACKVTAAVVKVASGATGAVKIAQVPNIVAALKACQKQGFWVYGTSLVGATDYTELAFDAKTVLVIGAEDKGIGRLVAETCDFLVKIPLARGVQSLNASVACGVLLFEIKRQRKE